MNADTDLTQPSMPFTTLGRLWRGLSSTAMTQIIAAANAFILVPLFLRAWGADGYGRWLSLTALLSYLSLIDLGGQSFIGNLLAVDYVRGDLNRFRCRLAEGVSLFSLISLIGFIILVSVLSLPQMALPGQSTPLPIEERIVLLCMGINVLIAIPGGVYASGYRATGQFARGTMIVNIGRSFTCGLTVMVLLLGLSPVHYAVAYLTSGMICTLLIVWDMRRQVPVSKGIRLSLVAAKAGSIFLNGSLQFWLMSVGNAINFQGVVLVLTAGAAPQVVALYVTHRTVSGLVGYVGSLLQGPLWPELTFLHAQGRITDQARVALLAVKTVVFLSGCAALALWFFLPIIYPLWTGKYLQIQPSLFSIFLIQAVLASGWSTVGWILLASNQHRFLAYWALANAVLTITLAMMLAPRWGYVGVAIATLTGDLVCGLAVYPYLSAPLLKLPFIKIYQALFQPILGILLLGVVFVGVSTLAVGWRGFIFGGLMVLLLLYPSLLLALGRDDLRWLFSMAERLQQHDA